MTLEAKKAASGFPIYVLACLLLSCTEKSKLSYVHISGPAQGTIFHITYQAVDEEDYTASIDSLFEVIDQSMSLWRDSSLINLVNKSSAPLKVDEHFEKVFRRAQYIHKLSGGAFDPTVGPLLKLWKFARKSQEHIPKPNEVKAILEHTGLSHFSLSEEGILSKDTPEATLDFNAIAQGYTVDVLALFLREKGITNYLIDVGGEIGAKGRNQSGEKWKVGIEKPDFNTGGERNAIETVLALENASLATSGSYRKYVEVGGKKYSHTINPQTGMPVNHQMLSVSVIDSSAMDADAYATVFMVFGRELTLEFANKNGLKVQCTSVKDGRYVIEQSKEFEKLELE